MCGRFYATDEMMDEIRKICRKIEVKGVQTGEIYPTNHAVILKAGEVDAEMMASTGKWGYILPGKPQVVFNARAESLSEKRLFKNDFLFQRCIVPAEGFYEWNKQKEKYYFTADKESILYMAGIYHKKDGEEYFTIITTEANSCMREVHARMPVILKKEKLYEWLFNVEGASVLLKDRAEQLQKEKQIKPSEYEQLNLFTDMYKR